MRCYDTSYRFFGDNERRNGRPISDLKALQKSKKPQALLPTVVRWARPRVICAPTFVPPFSSLHPSTLVSTPSVWALPQSSAIGP